jgi:hypothetical protein
MDDTDEIDSDTARVLDILAGVSRGQLDPDIDLLTIVAELDRSPNRILDPYLQRLIRDAYIN